MIYKEYFIPLADIVPVRGRRVAGWEDVPSPDATHWVQHDAAEEVNHYLVDFLLDKINQQVIR